MRNARLLTSAAAIAVLVGFFPHPALAQDEGSDGSQIVVTAQKRSERLLDAPQSVTAISAADLSRLNAVQFRDFANAVPALTFSTAGPGQTQLTLRGVTAGNDIGPTVGIYVDDVPFGSSSAFANASSLALDAGLFDMERIEVLRGPQGTLYGASTMGGLLKYVTIQPDADNFSGSANASLSDTYRGGTSYSGSAGLNLPIVNGKLGLRTSGYYSHDGGFIDNLAAGKDDVNRSRVYGGRADLQFTPTEDLTIRLSGFLQNIHRRGGASADFTLAGKPIDGSLDQRRLVDEPFDQRFRLVSGTISYDLGPASLTSISSYQTIRNSYRQDGSALYVPVLTSFGLLFNAVAVDQRRTTNKFTQEVRLASSGAKLLDWMVGGFYTHEKSGNAQVIVPYEDEGVVSPISLADVSIPSTYEEIAAFGNLTLHVTDRFDLSGGLRWAENRQKFEQIGSGLLIGSTPQVRSRDDVFTYLANARYKFSSNTTAYVRFATGYRPGGPNYVVNDPVTGAPLAPALFASDSLDSYEAGFKAETTDRTFGIDISGYHIDWKDIQVTTAAGGVSVIANAGGAKITGGELTLTARPSPQFTVVGAFAYQHARLSKDSLDLGALRGDRLPNVPRYTATLNADYRAPADMKLRPRLGATLRFVSDRSASFDGNVGVPQYELPDYVAIDLRAGLDVGRFEVQLFARNITDERAQLSAATVLSSAGGPAQVTMMQPRTIGVGLSSHF